MRIFLYPHNRFLGLSFWGKAISEVFLPLYTKQVVQITAPLVRDEEELGLQSVGLRNDKADVGATTEAANSGKFSETGAPIRQALQASIRAQEESLKAQKALLQLLL